MWTMLNSLKILRVTYQKIDIDNYICYITGTFKTAVLEEFQALLDGASLNCRDNSIKRDLCIG